MALFPLGILSAAAGVVGPTNSYELIQTTILGSNQATVDFTGLGSLTPTYKHLQIRVVAKDSFSGQFGDFYLTFNGSGANYRDHFLRGTSTTVTSSSYGYSSVITPGNIPGNRAENANMFGVYIIDIFDFASTVKNKTVRNSSGYVTANPSVFFSSGGWFDTSAITSFRLRSNQNLLAGSRFSLYGIRS
jgi:hypothetical protein